MKKLVLSAVALAFSTTVAFAADPMAGIIGNTLISKAGGTEHKYSFMADHTYTASDEKGAKMSGSWEDKDGKLCLMQATPAPAAGKEKVCTDSLAGKKAGDSWESTASDGSKYSVSVVKGM